MADIVEEYRTIASGVGWHDRSARGRIRFDGPDAASFLQALLSNDIGHLAKGDGAYAAYLTPQGRMVADIDVLHRGDWLLGGVAEGLGPSMAARFDQLIFSEAVTVTDVTASWAEIAVVGGAAPRELARLLAIDAADLETLRELAQLDWPGGFVARSGESLLPMFRVFVPAPGAPELRDRLRGIGASPVTPALVDTLRLEAGRPLWGQDLTSETIPLEAGLLDRAISTTKGCYVGQEIIIRILHRGGGRVAKRLSIVALDPTSIERPTLGAALIHDGHSVGHVTSTAYSPARHCVIAFAYIHRDVAETGQRLTVEGIDAKAAIVGFTA